MTKHKVTKTEIDGWYRYRGVTIMRDDSIKGYWGHWRATVGSFSQGNRQKLATEKRARLLQQIDAILDNQQ